MSELKKQTVLDLTLSRIAKRVKEGTKSFNVKHDLSESIMDLKKFPDSWGNIRDSSSLTFEGVDHVRMKLEEVLETEEIKEKMNPTS